MSGGCAPQKIEVNGRINGYDSLKRQLEVIKTITKKSAARKK